MLRYNYNIKIEITAMEQDEVRFKPNVPSTAPEIFTNAKHYHLGNTLK